jgi:hypothetical protein
MQDCRAENRRQLARLIIPPGEQLEHQSGHGSGRGDVRPDPHGNRGIFRLLLDRLSGQIGAAGMSAWPMVFLCAFFDVAQSGKILSTSRLKRVGT